MVKEYLRLKDQYPELDIDNSCGRLSVVYRYKNEKFHICLYFDQYKDQLENFISKFLAAKEAFEKKDDIYKKAKKAVEEWDLQIREFKCAWNHLISLILHFD